MSKQEEKMMTEEETAAVIAEMNELLANIDRVDKASEAHFKAVEESKRKGIRPPPMPDFKAKAREAKESDAALLAEARQMEAKINTRLDNVGRGIKQLGEIIDEQHASDIGGRCDRVYRQVASGLRAIDAAELQDMKRLQGTMDADDAASAAEVDLENKNQPPPLHLMNKSK